MATTSEDTERLQRRSGRNRIWIVAVVIAVAVVLIAVAAFAGLFSPPAVEKIRILGVGATFPCPLITKWRGVYENTTGGRVSVNYNCVGSGAGISQITAKTVDFAGTDAPLKPSERAAAPGLLHIPETIGAVTAAYNVASLSSGLNLTGHVLGEIYLGKITTWNHANISALNPGVALPASSITVVYRSDSSGTTFVWTSYLRSRNPGWGTSLVGKQINFPVGTGASGNFGVAGTIQSTPNSIGYVELSYTIQNNMKVAKIRNGEDSNWVLPSLASTAAAAASFANPPTPGGDWANVSILNAAGANSYPIASLTYLLVYKELNVIGSSMTKAKAQALVDFLWWAIHTGQDQSEALAYPKLPASLVTLDEGAINSITFNGQTLHS
jgi:phosphate ABC transporter phosphate-binding protein